MKIGDIDIGDGFVLANGDTIMNKEELRHKRVVDAIDFASWSAGKVDPATEAEWAASIDWLLASGTRG